MRILYVGYPLFPVSRDAAGGAEQILSLLEQGVAERGQQTVVVAAAGSRVRGELIETRASNGEIITDRARLEAQDAHRERIEWILKQLRIDLVHFHGLDFAQYLPETSVPMLATLHLPVDWYREPIFGLARVKFCCVSESQARTAPEGVELPVIANGIEVSRYRMAAERGTGLLWLGRICPEKGTEIALRVAHRLGLALTVAGPVHGFASHQRYFAERVQPLLDEKRKYVGAVGREEKVRLLAEAGCLLIPSLAAETGSLVAMEAAAAGTAVIAMRAGALPEIVEHGVTGFIVSSEDEMAQAVNRVGEISSERCRSEAARRFDADRMVGDYLRLYERLLRELE